MKKLITCLMLLTVFALSAQQSYWTNYTFIVEPENESTVFKLIDDYFKEHKTEGVSVSLYANHFHDADNAATHMIVFSGSLDALSGMYAADGGDEQGRVTFCVDDARVGCGLEGWHRHRRAGRGLVHET